MNIKFDALLKECPAFAILRGVKPTEILAVCNVLFGAGIRLLEIPLNSPDALDSIRLAAEHCPENGMIGAGTVLTPEDVRNVANAGGKYIISPNTDTAVIRETVSCKLVSIPGFFTASEAFTAIAAGADYLKFFPADCMGPDYVKVLKSVIKCPILAVGGVGHENIGAFLKVCAGVGIGRALYKTGKPLDEIRRDSLALVAALNA